MLMRGTCCVFRFGVAGFRLNAQRKGEVVRGMTGAAPGQGPVIDSPAVRPALRIDRMGDSLVLVLSGDWKLGGSELPSLRGVEGELDRHPLPVLVGFATGSLGGWDSSLLTFLLDVTAICSQKKISLERKGLPQGVQRLLDLAGAVPEAKEALRHAPHESFLARLGDRAVSREHSILDTVAFVGEVTASLARMFVGKARFRSSDLWLTLQESGSQALPIVSLISLLVGLILAFVGSVQLKLFGAQAYVANLVGFAMVRAMAAIMTGIIMAGRTGASFAAQIGTMHVNEEIDALQTAGIRPIDFLVLPRLVGLSLMMPLLTLYADFMGMVGGLIVAVTDLHLGVVQYYNETRHAVTLTNIGIGLFSGLVFGVLVAIAGCLRGIQSGRSASAVGDATKSAVVTGIVGIIVATAIITVMCTILGI